MQCSRDSLGAGNRVSKRGTIKTRGTKFYTTTFETTQMIIFNIPNFARIRPGRTGFLLVNA